MVTRPDRRGVEVYHARSGAFIGVVGQRTLSLPVKIDGRRDWVDVSIDFLLGLCE